MEHDPFLERQIADRSRQEEIIGEEVDAMSLKDVMENICFHPKLSDRVWLIVRDAYRYHNTSYLKRLVFRFFKIRFNPDNVIDGLLEDLYTDKTAADFVFHLGIEKQVREELTDFKISRLE